MKKQHIENVIQSRILVLDGAMGTMIQQYHLSESDYAGNDFSGHSYQLTGCNDLLNLTKPDVVAQIHQAYIKAGADIIETNTFNANRISLADYGLESHVYEINRRGAQIAAQCANELSTNDFPVYVAGSIGPTGKSASMSPHIDNPAFRSIDFKELQSAYEEQAEGLIDGGCDVLLVETVFDTLNAKAALFAIFRVFEKKSVSLPVMLSVTITDQAGRTLSGQTPEAFLTSVSHFPLFSVGFNCALGAEQMTPFLSQLSNSSPFYVSVYPNAGLPNHMGGYDETASEMSEIIRTWIQSGFANIVGGCCGTTPDHIRLLKQIALDAAVPQKKQIQPKFMLSGLELLTIDENSNFINVGERTNVAGSARFAKHIREKKYDEALTIARQQIENGAQIIDINLDDALLDSKHEMVHFLRLLASEPQICRVPFMIDSSCWEVIEAALQNIQGKCLVNSISLKDGEAEFIRRARLLREYGAAVVVMAFDEKGQAVNYESKIRICERAYGLMTKKAGFKPCDIIFDCNILTIGTGIPEHQNYAVDFIRAVRWVKQNLSGTLTSGGLSNLSFAFRGNNALREALHSVFLYHAVQSGLDMAIVNAGVLPLYDEMNPELRVLCADLILNRRNDATERLLEYANGMSTISVKSEVKDCIRNRPLEERLVHSLVHGISDYIEEDMAEALIEYDMAVEIIEKPLMSGMNKVGQLFGEGKMFLPQVMKSAGVMKKAVDILQPVIQMQNASSGIIARKGRIVLATVKGDVHDIGKNIAGLVLSCNNFEIYDLGIMVPAETIVSRAIELKADMIGLSGLITPSLDEMIRVARLMEQNKMNIPLLISGATTSEIHTALKIAPVYSGPVIHLRDASVSVKAAADLMNHDSKKKLMSDIAEHYSNIRKRYEENKIRSISFSQARNNRYVWNIQGAEMVVPSITGVRTIKVETEYLTEFINWSYFFRQWRINARFPDVFNHPQKGEEAKKLHHDAQKMLHRLCKEKLIQPSGVYGLFKAASKSEQIVLYSENGTQEVLNFLRDCSEKHENERNLCLSDFIAPFDSGVEDYMGLFAVTARITDNMQFESPYEETMVKILADRLAEAFSEYLFLQIRNEYLGLCKRRKKPN
jgi:5-methyltetrahydrofolate--homocysteine methyltransferase